MLIISKLYMQKPYKLQIYQIYNDFSPSQIW